MIPLLQNRGIFCSEKYEQFIPFTTQNLIRSKKRKRDLKKLLIISNKKCRKFKRFPAFFGRGDGDRTHDLSVPNAARYQLRYASYFHGDILRKRIYYSKRTGKCQTFLPTNMSFFLSA